jgi:putative tricarboxylic transport membrane protein
MTAFLLAAFLLHGVTPGPFLLRKHPEVFWGIVTSMYVGNAMLLVLNLPLIGVFVNMLKVPYRFLCPIIALLCFVGAYSQTSNPTDLVLLVIFGIVGYLMKRFGYEPAPLMLAYVIGPMLESSFRRALLLSNSSLSIFIKSPISIILLAVAFLSLISPLLQMGYRKVKETVNSEQ